MFSSGDAQQHFETSLFFSTFVFFEQIFIDLQFCVIVALLAHTRGLLERFRPKKLICQLENLNLLIYFRFDRLTVSTFL